MRGAVDATTGQPLSPRSYNNIHAHVEAQQSLMTPLQRPRKASSPRERSPYEPQVFKLNSNSASSTMAATPDGGGRSNAHVNDTFGMGDTMSQTNSYGMDELRFVFRFSFLFFWLLIARSTTEESNHRVRSAGIFEANFLFIIISISYFLFSFSFSFSPFFFILVVLFSRASRSKATVIAASPWPLRQTSRPCTSASSSTR
jgi:hypothetical protein